MRVALRTVAVELLFPFHHIAFAPYFAICLLFLSLALRSARVIGTDALRLFLTLREPGDGQERKQDSEDDPDINAHQGSLAASLPA